MCCRWLDIYLLSNFEVLFEVPDTRIRPGNEDHNVGEFSGFYTSGYNREPATCVTEFEHGGRHSRRQCSANAGQVFHIYARGCHCSLMSWKHRHSLAMRMMCHPRHPPKHHEQGDMRACCNVQESLACTSWRGGA